MKYSYNFRLEKNDMLLYYLIDRYSSFAGVVQVIFTASMAILLVKKWGQLDGILQPLVILGLLLFPVIQPIVFNTRAAKAVKPDIPETYLGFGESEMVIKVLEHVQRIKYQDIVQVISKPLMIIIQADKTHIYILPHRVLGKEKKELFSFLEKHILEC